MQELYPPPPEEKQTSRISDFESLVSVNQVDIPVTVESEKRETNPYQKKETNANAFSPFDFLVNIKNNIENLVTSKKDMDSEKLD